MTITYDPKHPAYYDEADLRHELTRVYDLCHGCRMCFNLCPSFPSLFEMVDARDGAVHELTPAEQDRVVDECYQCKLCFVKCPYTPPHEWELDFPRLMLRAQAVRRKQSGLDLTDQFLGRTDLLGRVSTVAAPVVNKVTGTPGSLPRRVMEKVAGIAAERVLPPYARQRFTTWFRKRGPSKPSPTAPDRGTVTIFPTCLVEYQDPTVGHDAVRVYERNGITCEVADGVRCCGMPWLDGGDVDNFVAQGRRNVEILAAEVRKGRDIVVPQPTCGYVLKKEYPDYVGGDDAKLVSEHTFDIAEYLMRAHKSDAGPLDTSFTGSVPEEVTYHVACHLQAQNIGLKSRDLMKLTGTKITLVNQCSGIDGTWGYRAENYELARKVAQPLKAKIEAAPAEVITGDCHLANGAIYQETGRTPIHPIQMVARAYGLPSSEQAR